MASLAQILTRSASGTKLPQRFQPLLGQALNEALVRYGGAYDELERVRSRESGTFRQNRDQANSAAQLIGAQALQAQTNLDQRNPLIQRLAQYDNAPANSSAAVVAQNLGLTHDATRSMLATTARNAPITAAQQIQRLGTEHEGALEEIEGKRAGILGETSNYVTGRLQDLIGEDRKRRSDLNQNLRSIKTQIRGQDTSAATQRRGQDKSSADRALDREIARERLEIERRRAGAEVGPGGVKRATPTEHRSLKDQVEAARAVIAKRKALGEDRHKVAGLLKTGRNEATVERRPGDPGYDPRNPAKNKAKVPGLPKVPESVLTLALDLEYDKGLSRKNVGRLHQDGYSVQRLGLPTTRGRKPRRRVPDVNRLPGLTSTPPVPQRRRS